MSEYLRRAGMAMRDDDFLMEEIRRRFPHERILVVRYGDHQPSATREYPDRLTGRPMPQVTTFDVHNSYTA
jgi:hypothetical protein